MRTRSVLGWTALGVAYALMLGVSVYGLYGLRAKEIRRDGYTITSPKGWSDISEEARDGTVDGTPDLVLEGPDFDDGLPRTRIVIARNPVYAQPSVERMALSLVDLASTEPAEATAPRYLTIDGERAAVVDFHGDFPDERDGRFIKRRVVTRHGDRTYTVSLIATKGRFTEHARELDRLLRGWAWTP
jgi:hypothetical protein